MILLSEDAERDIEDIYHYVAGIDASTKADRLLDSLEETCRSLAEMPERGISPRNWRRWG